MALSGPPCVVLRFPPALVTLPALDTQRPDPEVDSLVFKMLQILFTFQVMPLSIDGMPLAISFYPERELFCVNPHDDIEQAGFFSPFWVNTRREKNRQKGKALYRSYDDKLQTMFLPLLFVSQTRYFPVCRIFGPTAVAQSCSWHGVWYHALRGDIKL